MTRKQRRMTLIASGVGVLAVAATLVLYALRGSIVFFNSPTDLVEKRVEPGTHVRLGGMVVAGSVVHDGNLMVRFAVSDGHNTVAVACPGRCATDLPDLFREGQGVVTEGMLDPAGTFQAQRVLAKHDERYMPKEVAEALKRGDDANKRDGATRTP